MKFFFLTFLLISLITHGNANVIKLKIHNQTTENGYKVMADNDEFCPVSVKIDFDLNNLTSTQGNNKIFIIPAKTKGFFISDLEIIKKGSYGFSLKTNSNYGDATILQPDDYNYSLPFQKGLRFKIHQGYNGDFSHQNENSLDFSMPIGTQIVAVRDGIVVKVVKNNNRNCAEKKCAEFNNYLLLYHSDGTFSKYLHFKFNGISVKEGDFVKENDVIGSSGNVGWTNGPHLHLMIFIQRIEKSETIKTKFKIEDGSVSRILNKNDDCFKNY
jgi:murein DD-endopeptidase MepM/ murein hydrolase activator NlpD